MWHGMTHEDVAKHSPMLADRFAVSTASGIDHVVAEIVKAVGRPNKVAVRRRRRTAAPVARAARRTGRRPKRS